MFCFGVFLVFFSFFRPARKHFFFQRNIAEDLFNVLKGNTTEEKNSSVTSVAMLLCTLLRVILLYVSLKEESCQIMDS